MRLGKGSILRRPEGSEISCSLRALAKKSGVPKNFINNIKVKITFLRILDIQNFIWYSLATMKNDFVYDCFRTVY